MTLEEAQEKVHAYVSQFKEGYWPPLSNLARMIEELGELSRELNHSYGPKKKKSTKQTEKKAASNHSKIEEEIGDLLFTLICIANSENVKLAKSLEKTIQKYNSRDSYRWEKREQNS